MSVTRQDRLRPATVVEVVVPSFDEDTSRALHGTPCTISIDKSILPDRVWMEFNSPGLPQVTGLTYDEALALAEGLVDAVECGRYATRPRNVTGLPHLGSPTRPLGSTQTPASPTGGTK
jgi:hypothetical protein